MSELSKVLGDRIRIIRNEKGFSIEELAHSAEISTTHLGRVERGDRSPTIDMLGKIVKALGISFVELFNNFNLPNENDTILATLINRLNSLNNKEQKELLIILDSLFRIIKD